MMVTVSASQRSNPCRCLPHNHPHGGRPAPTVPTVGRKARGCVRTTVPKHAPMARHPCNLQPRVAVDRRCGSAHTVASRVPRHSQARLLHPGLTCDPQNTPSPPCLCEHAAATGDRPTHAGTASSPHRLAPPPVPTTTPILNLHLE
jgi:hypothetical protein